jgi:hypothetical protein
MKRKLSLPNFIVALGIIYVLILVATQIFDKTGLPEKNLNVIQASQKGVCPPFNLYDEDGKIIDPVHRINAEKPYSPKQTCGAEGCHDYDKITEGYHFQQGKGEEPNQTFKERYQWVTSPGNYGGNWCSPAPVYRQLARKNNASAKDIDMTSYEFITATCGNCHPGGGSLELDRNGKRYDHWMNDSSSNLEAKGDNNFDGDYYKANWANTGVLEADCMLCHLPEYNYNGRNDQIAKENFRWAATEGSTLAKVDGTIKGNKPVTVEYDISRFDTTGKLSLHLVRDPRNETCLNCHAKPDWKKKGTSYISRRDVHINAGLRCVDCHPAGSNAVDERVKGKEIHQFGKGDDPSGNVRDDLDNTVRSCESCHLTGYLNAPLAKHSWLPPLHLEKIACQTCHIKERPVKAAMVQASDVFNTGPKIMPPAKRIWTFYDANMNYWNHYGELNMFTASDQPTDQFTPSMAKYKNKIYPVNMVHSSWPGIYTEGKPGLDQPKMKDIFGMWTQHNADSTKYPKLSLIKDGNNDGVDEVNTREEIDALISSVTEHLTNLGYNLTGKKIVWVNNDKMYFSGNNFKLIPKEEYEASPYASVYKYSHNVLPAKAALGTNGCVECHSLSSSVYFSEIVKYPFYENGKTVTEPQYARLGISGVFATIGAIRESILKPVLYGAIGLLLILILVWAALYFRGNSWGPNQIKNLEMSYLGLIGASIIGFIALIFSPDLTEDILPGRQFLDSNHFLTGILVLLTGILIYVKKNRNGFSNVMGIVLLSAFISGIFMILKFDFLESITRVAYTLFDLSLVSVVIITILSIVSEQLIKFKENYSQHNLS